ncbi:MAG: hypothetical protein WC623_22460 [Pedobacter sp.]|uniref:hypothetical protein n=1 Tax=Pedobacter sp. TaxID=1411316 RepID=UPI003567604F
MEISEKEKSLIEAIKTRKPVIEYPFGNPDELLERIAEIAKEWQNNNKPSESAMSGIYVILAQNKRI